MTLGPGAARADSVLFYLGGASIRGDSRLWEEIVTDFDVTLDDLLEVCGGGAFAHALNERLDLEVGAAFCGGTDVTAPYRDYIREDGTEIQQTFDYAVVPITVGLRFAFLAPSARFRPYVAGGGGLYPYRFVRKGEFIDFQTARIYGDELRDSGLGLGLYAGVGTDIRLGSRSFFFLEGRFDFAGAEHGDDMDGFGHFDLSSWRLDLGVAIRLKPRKAPSPPGE